MAKSVLVPLGLTAAVSAIDAAIQKKIFESQMTTIIFLNEDIMKMVKSFEGSGLLRKRVCETVENEVKEKKKYF